MTPIVTERQARGKKLVWIELGKGRRIQMYEEDARAQGLLPEEPKGRRAGRNKVRQPAKDK